MNAKEEVCRNLGSNLRTLLLAEIVQLCWNKEHVAKEKFKERLIEIYYEKAALLFRLGYTPQARSCLEQVNALHALRKEWPIYPRLLELANRLRGGQTQNQAQGFGAEEQKTEGNGLLGFIASAVSELLPKKQTSGASDRVQAPPPAQEAPAARSNFYYDQAKGQWIIDGKEADTEYDMGQEPAGPRAKGEDVPPPPVAARLARQVRESEPPADGAAEVAAESIKNPFGVQVPQTRQAAPGGKKKSPIRALYVPQ